MNNERDRLVKELKDEDSKGLLLYGEHGDELNYGAIADFIINDRKRIVEPLVEFKKEYPHAFKGYLEAIDQTLKNAGVE